ncbi:MAG TPA: hypothetical protein VGZ91_15530 [Candidatus Sulfotelmatobacter sp.]|jgi:hypothetical protein|nr:hypothetical protein [Candidatus Sulfotelmatobacter sp.]
MELLLNLAWVLMALPAYWLWRRGAGARAEQRVSALQFLLALGCVLVLLFPVISATDDLHAMRTEMEESSTSKRAVRQASSDKHSAWVNRLQGPPALVANLDGPPAPEAGRLEVSVLCLAPLARPCRRHAGRAPPNSLLG